MNRKQFVNLGAVVASAILVPSLKSDDHKGHSMGKNPLSKAMMASIHCKMAAEICLGHCLEMMGKGDKSLSPCAQSARDVIAACDSFLSLASNGSKFIKKQAKLCAEICDSCAEECKKHANKHESCKECLDSCLLCSKEMAKV